MPALTPYEDAARGIAAYLASRQQPTGAFPGPDHYGVAASLWLWSHFGAEFSGCAERAVGRLAASPPDSHGEFNAYALLSSRERLGSDRIAPLLRGVRFGGRHSANWMLLRAVCRAGSGSPASVLRAKLEARAALLRYMRCGFIADRPGVRSFAYHAFSGALLADLWRETRWRWAGLAAARAARFIAPFVLPNGDALYIGRGQEQIFGHGALLYLLEAAAQMTGEEALEAAAARAFGHLMSFQRPDGSFPLVLNDDEPPEPWAWEPRPGWYSYNRYADYLPFLGCMLMKAAAPGMPRLEENADARAARHPGFRIHVEERYTAVLVRPGGAPTNDLAFPYVCVDGVSLFPCYGGERAAPPEAMPLPYGVLADGRRYPFRDRLRYRLTDRGLIGESSLVRHAREFDFQPDGFICRDEITFRRACRCAEFVPANYLFLSLSELGDGGFETHCRGVSAVLRLDQKAAIRADAAVTASGGLTALRSVREPFAARPGEVVSAKIEVRFR
jgi:hypothetical protein